MAWHGMAWHSVKAFLHGVEEPAGWVLLYIVLSYAGLHYMYAWACYRYIGW